MFECPAINKVCNSCKTKGSFEKVRRTTDKVAGVRKKEKNNVNHASDKTDEQVIKTSDEKLYYTQPFEEVNFVHPAPEEKEIGTDGYMLKMKKDSGSLITIISTEMWAKLCSRSLR